MIPPVTQFRTHLARKSSARSQNCPSPLRPGIPRSTADFFALNSPEHSSSRRRSRARLIAGSAVDVGQVAATLEVESGSVEQREKQYKQYKQYKQLQAEYEQKEGDFNGAMAKLMLVRSVGLIPEDLAPPRATRCRPVGAQTLGLRPSHTGSNQVNSARPDRSDTVVLITTPPRGWRLRTRARRMGDMRPHFRGVPAS